MAQAKLRRTQLVMLLTKRSNIGDNELFEMMRSREVYHVQTELRKELDRTIKALQHSEKMRISGFMTQRAMFLKRVNVLERNRQYLTNVERSLGKGNFQEQHIIQDNVFLTREESGRHLQLPRVDFNSDSAIERGTKSHRQKLTTTSTALSNIHYDTDQQTSKERTENMIVLPSMNSEWMNKVKENSGLESAKSNKSKKKTDDRDENSEIDSSKSKEIKKKTDNRDEKLLISSDKVRKNKKAFKDFSVGTDNGGIQKKESNGDTTMSRNNISKAERESVYQVGKSYSEDTVSKENKEVCQVLLNSDHPPKIQKDMTHREKPSSNTTSATVLKERSRGNSPVAEEDDVLKELPLIKHKRHSKPEGLISVILHVDSKKVVDDKTFFADKEIKSTFTSSSTAEVGDALGELPSHNEYGGTFSPPKHNRYSKPESLIPIILDGESEKDVDRDLDVADKDVKSNSVSSSSHADRPTKTDPFTEKEAIIQNQTTRRSLTSVEPYLGRSRAEEFQPIKLKPDEAAINNRPRPFVRKAPVVPKLPYLRRSQSHPNIASRPKANKNLAYLNLAGNLERTVTMVFVEDPSFHRDPPKSLFDFEAWLAYNRRKRGYTKILDEKQLCEADKSPAKKKGGKKRKSTNRVRFSISKSANVETESKSFREKSKEWYLNFLKVQNSAEHHESRQEREKNRRYSMAVKAGLTFLPRIGVKTSNRTSSGEAPKTAAEQYNNIFYNDTSGPKVARETTEQKLKRLKDQTKGLQTKVQNFVSSPCLFKDQIEH